MLNMYKKYRMYFTENAIMFYGVNENIRNYV